jgi:hypothetical protein
MLVFKVLVSSALLQFQKSHSRRRSQSEAFLQQVALEGGREEKDVSWGPGEFEEMSLD